MSGPLRVAAFGAAVVALFGLAFGLARVVDADGLARASDERAGGHGGEGHGGDGKAEEEGGGHGAEPAGGALPGLQVATGGYRLVPAATTLAPGEAVDFRFSLLGPDGRPVSGYQVLHERELHLIAVRRDLAGFQHVHPERAADGTWSVPLDLRLPGTWRIFADFAPTGGPDQLTLGVDVHVPGGFDPSAGPSPADPDTGGHDVRFDREGGTVTVTVTRDGRPAALEPYLGAGGHLVVLRAGDLAYLHVHPEESPEGTVRFVADLPSAGSYAMFFDYQVGGVVRTAAAMTEEVR